MRRGTSLLVAVAASAILSAPSQLWALPSPLDHVHTALTVDWQQPGSPALPWSNAVANANNHQHLTGDPLSNGARWDINKAWDNRTLHLRTANPNNYAHGMIMPDQLVRYGFTGGLMPAPAKTVIEAGYKDWVAQAKVAFNANKEPWDAIAIGFQRADTGAREITITFQEGFQEAEQAYAAFAPGAKVLTFEATPTIGLATTGGLKQIRLGNAGASGVAIDIPTPWSYDGTPNGAMTDIDYSVDGGVSWTDAPPVGFGNLEWFAGEGGHFIAPADQIEFFEMDFTTISRHEIGHTVALLHTGNNTAPIMQDDIADEASFGATKGIQGDDALAAAIAYTWSFNQTDLKDYGDAPNSYRTLLASDGPRYADGSVAKLGSLRDMEPDGQPSFYATGDDENYWGVGGPDDEDGVVFGPTSVDITVVVAGGGDLLLRAWWDLNQNGFFDHTSELIIDDMLGTLSAGSHNFHYDLGFDPRIYYSRFRLTWATEGHLAALGDVTPWGEYFDEVTGISFGEVEDYVAPEPGTFFMLALGGLASLWYTARRSRADR
jgi:hypothetical protein